MRRLFTGIELVIALLCSISHVQGQKATERYIPIGQSPGLSDKYTYIGSIESIDAQKSIVTGGGGRTIRVTEQTKIWLDRTGHKLTNLMGRFADLKSGQRCEIKYVDPDRKQVAEWIKVKIAQP